MPEQSEPRGGAPVPRVWVVRAGRGAVHANMFLGEGLVAISYGVDQSIKGLSWDEITSVVQKVMPDEPAVSVGLAVGALNRFADVFQPGDFVVTPEHTNTMLLGELTGYYRYVDPPTVEDYSHVRDVRWFGRMERGRLPEHVRKSLGSAMTLFEPGFQDELLSFIRPTSTKTTAPQPLATPTSVRQPVVTTPVHVEMIDEPAVPSGSTGSRFETDKRELLFFLEQIRNRDLALPDFQRSFVWDSGATRELIVSIVRTFPAGNILLLRGGSEVFLPRAVEEAPALDGQQPTYLVLDGQQRLSSLFQAFAGLGAHRFFIDIGAIMRGEDLDAAIKAFSTSRSKPWSDISGQARSLMFPLARVRDFNTWRDEIITKRMADATDDETRLRSYLNEVESAVIAPIRAYQFPVTTLSAETPTEAVCTIFETLNRTGIKLSVFELICARAFAEGHRLRERWKLSLAEHAVLEEFEIDPYYLLQTIALRVGKKPQRSIVASLDVRTIIDNWDASARGMAEGLVMLRDECGVLTPKWLPYAPLLPTLAAAWRDVDLAQGPVAGRRRLNLQRWFWCASFLGDYDNAPNSRAEADVPLLHRWLTGGDPPPVVSDFSFDPETWLDITGRQRGLYRSTVALLMRRHALDFHLAIPLTRAVIETTAVDDHHIFPSAYLRDEGGNTHADTVLNHTLIDKLTNIRISKKAPSVYLAEIDKELHEALPRVLRSHGLPEAMDGPLWTDDYEAFLTWRPTSLPTSWRL